MYYLSPKSEVSTVYSGMTLHYYGFEFSNSNDIWGKKYYKAVCAEGDCGYYVTSLYSAGIENENGFYAPYKGFYANGQLKEEGEILVESFGLPGKPFPDRHNVLNGKYYKPDGTLGSVVSQGTGTQTLWYPNGQMQWELELLDGQRVRCKQFSESGKLISKVEYIDGKEVYLETEKDSSESGND